MRTIAFMLALVALPLATPSFAAGAKSNVRDVETCNQIADAHGVTGRARGSFVMQCMER